MDYSYGIVSLPLSVNSTIIAIAQWLRANNFPVLHLTSFRNASGICVATVSEYASQAFQNDLIRGRYKWFNLQGGIKLINRQQSVVFEVDNRRYIMC